MEGASAVGVAVSGAAAHRRQRRARAAAREVEKAVARGKLLGVLPHCHRNNEDWVEVIRALRDRVCAWETRSILDKREVTESLRQEFSDTLSQTAKVSEVFESKVSALAYSVSQLESAVHVVRDDLGHLSRDSVVRFSGMEETIQKDKDALSQSVECIGKLEDKLIKEIHARRSMRDNLLASVVAETSSRTELEERVNELVNSFQFVAERVDVIDDWLNNRFGGGR